MANQNKHTFSKNWIRENHGDKIFLNNATSFLDEDSRNVIMITQWQYWWWFWFTLLISIYFLFIIRILGQRTLNNNPHLVTSYRARGRWGDLIICAIPIFWCINILTNSHHLLRVIEWQSETALIVLRVRGKQWYWIYKYDLSNYYNPEKSFRYVGRGKKMPVSKYELYRDTIINVLQRDKKNLDNVLTTSVGGLKADMHSIKKALFMKKYHYFQKTHFNSWTRAYAAAQKVNKPTSEFVLIRLLNGKTLKPLSGGNNPKYPQKPSFLWALKNLPFIQYDIDMRIKLIKKLDDARTRIRSHKSFTKCDLLKLMETQPEYLTSSAQLSRKYENLVQETAEKFPANTNLKLITNATTLHLLNTKYGNKFMHLTKALELYKKYVTKHFVQLEEAYVTARYKIFLTYILKAERAKLLERARAHQKTMLQLQTDLRSAQSQALRHYIDAVLRNNLRKHFHNPNLELNESSSKDDIKSTPNEPKDVYRRLEKEISIFPHLQTNLLLLDTPIKTWYIDTFMGHRVKNLKLRALVFGSSTQKKSAGETKNDQARLLNVKSTTAINYLLYTLPTRRTGHANSIKLQTLKHLNLSDSINEKTNRLVQQHITKNILLKVNNHKTEDPKTKTGRVGEPQSTNWSKYPTLIVLNKIDQKIEITPLSSKTLKLLSRTNRWEKVTYLYPNADDLNRPIPNHGPWVLAIDTTNSKASHSILDRPVSAELFNKHVARTWMKWPGLQTKTKLINQVKAQIQEQNKRQSTARKHQLELLNFKLTKPTRNVLARNYTSLKDQTTKTPTSQTTDTQRNSNHTKQLPPFYTLKACLNKYFKPSNKPAASKLQNLTIAAHNKLALAVLKNRNLSPALQAFLKKTTAGQDTKLAEKENLPQKNSHNELNRLFANYVLEIKLHEMFIFGVSDPKILKQLKSITRQHSQSTDLLVKAGLYLLKLTKTNKNKISFQTQNRTPRFKRVSMATTKPTTWPSIMMASYLTEKYSLSFKWAEYKKFSVGSTKPLTLMAYLHNNKPQLKINFNDSNSHKEKSIIPVYGVVKQKKSPRDKYASKLRDRVPRRILNFDQQKITDAVSIDKTLATYYKSAVIDYQSKNIKLIERMRGAPTSYMYPDKKRLLWVNKQIILPTETPITIITNSFDVMHSWFIPGLALKLDCVPGRSTHHTIYIEHPGYYYGQCAEICGRRHHHMPIKIYAVPFREFLFWWRTKYYHHDD